MRSRNSLFNILAIIFAQISSLVMGLLARQAFLAYLPIDLLGVSDLFTSFFYALSLVDIGFGSLLILSLYKPINEKNEKETIKYISVFRKIYFIIGGFITVVSLAAMPFLYVFFKIDYANVQIVYAIYLIQLLTNVSKYFFMHKMYILQLYQKNYIITIITMLMDWICFAAKMVSIIVFKNYILYLLSILLEGVIINVISIMITNKKYPYLKKIPRATMEDVKNCDTLKRTKNFMYSTIYSFVFYSSDNIIISATLGTNPLSYMNNYLTIITIVDNFVSTCVNSLRESLANYMHVEKDNKGLYDTYRMSNILSFFVSSIMLVGLFTMFDRWIDLWIGGQYLIDSNIKNVLICILGIDLLLRPIENIYHIKGYRFIEKWPLLLSALGNIVISIILVNQIGLIGIYIGTIVGKIVYWIGKIYYVAGDAFKEFRKSLLSEIFVMYVLIVFECVSCKCIVDAMNIETTSLLIFLLQCMICVIYTSTINLLVFSRTPYLKKLFHLVMTSFGFKKKEITNE